MRSLTGEEPDERVVERVHERSGGNPLFVVELTRLFASEGGPGPARSEAVPAAVRDVVRRRLARLPEGTLGLLPAAAVLGPELDLRTLTDASGVAVDTCLDDLDPAVVTRVLVPDGDGRFAFGHALVRDAVLSDLSPLRRARLHQRAADAIEAVFGADFDHAEPIAAHRWAAAAVDDPLRVTDALRAAEVARRHSALDAVEELLDRTVEAARRLPAGPVREDREIDAMERLLHIETVCNFMSRDLPGFAARIEDIAARQLATFVRWSVITRAGGLSRTSSPGPRSSSRCGSTPRTWSSWAGTWPGCSVGSPGASPRPASPAPLAPLRRNSPTWPPTPSNWPDIGSESSRSSRRAWRGLSSGERPPSLSSRPSWPGS
jgi:hypothetical protein